MLYNRERVLIYFFSIFAIWRAKMSLESSFQAHLIKRLRNMYPEGIVLKNDPNFLQGITDILILVEDRWAALETKKDPTSSRRPNQQYYVDKLNRMSFAAFIEPENEEEVLHELQQALGTRR